MKTGSKPPNQAHTSAGKASPKSPRSMKNTMGTGKVTPKAKGAMGKNQSTGSGGA